MSLWDAVWVSHVVAAMLLVGLAVHVTRHHFEKPIGRAFVLLVVAFTIWIGGSVARMLTLDPTVYVLFTAGKYLGVATGPVWFGLFALRYSGRDHWVTRRLVAALLVIPVVTVGVIVTTEVHGLFYTGFAVTTVGETQVLTTSRGAWFWVFAAFGWGLLALSTILLIQTAIGQSPFYQRQSAVVILGIAIPWVVGITYIFRDWPHPAVDPTPLGFAVSAVLFWIGLFDSRLIDIVPVARSQLLDALDDAVFVVDCDDRLLDGNDTARELILGDVAIGTDVTEVLPREAITDGAEYVVETEDGRRVFRPKTIQLTDSLDRTVGRVVFLNDVTDVIERERRSVLQRVLRHNIRNDLNVTTGHLDVLEGRVSPGDRIHVERAQESAHRVIELSEKARAIERALQRPDRSTTVSVPSIIEGIVESARREYPQSAIAYETDYESSAEPTAAVVSEELFRTAIAALVENAVVHNTDARPRAVVRVTTENGAVRVRVSDNGPGIPDEELAVLTATTETPLEHGSGLGLWLVKWMTSLSSGELTFSENEPRGTVVTVTVPVAESSR